MSVFFQICLCPILQARLTKERYFDQLLVVSEPEAALVRCLHKQLLSTTGRKELAGKAEKMGSLVINANGENTKI